MDVLTKEQRSYNMSRIRSRWTSPERIAHNLLKGWKIKHRMHPKMVGNPDILLTGTMTVVFIDGCFWHGCPTCFVKPTTNAAFWRKKIENNRRRAREVNAILRSERWHVIRIWEHEMRKDQRRAIGRILHAVRLN